MVIATQSANIKETSQSDGDKTQPEIGVCSLIWMQLSTIWPINNALQMFSDSGIYELIDRMIMKAFEHPLIAMTVAIAVLAVGLPLLGITIFVLATVTLTFSGFIVIEGILISIAWILLFGCMGATLIVFLFFAGAFLVSYFGFLHIYDLYLGLHNKSAVTSFLKREQRNES